MNYYISDMHFFHKNVTKEGNNFDNRPFNSLAEMHEYMKERWNRKVTNGFLAILPCAEHRNSLLR